ncbi:hypothetical protein [Blastococcus tunisiensis]|uniref:Uncharacterized protein n=1 Tax=Blastococcus tunisiensis TaxID=1798228 RepID=A0A1I2FU51_9ACTN|nr:hypothetical protein [Blastococcus sp. DSM 46838]SFF08180.1 hypothetical protein SAMN05216574_108206 [Blastococcus sp. DSM 46838]
MDDDTMQEPGRPDRARRGWARSIALVGGGLVAGGILAGTLTATAATDEGTADDEGAAADCPGGRGSGGPFGDEEALTGDTATSVEEAVLDEYPDATVRWLLTDSDGAYQALVLTADGERLHVELDESFAITDTEAHAAGSGRGPGRGFGHGHGHGGSDEGTTDDGTTDDGSAD